MGINDAHKILLQVGRLFLLIASSILLSAVAHAATVTWIGPSSGTASWQDGSNWSTNPAAPASTDDVVFPASTTTTVNLGAAQTVNSIRLAGSMVLGGDAAFQTLTINVTTLPRDGAGVGLFVPPSAGPIVMNCNVMIASNQTWEIDSLLNNLTVTGVLSGPGTSTLTISGASVLNFGGATPAQNTFTGAIAIKSGVLAIQSIGALTNINSITGLSINGASANSPATLRYLSAVAATLPAVDIALGANNAANIIDVTQGSAQLLVATNRNLTGGPVTPATALLKTGPGLFGTKPATGTTASNTTIGDIRILNGAMRASPASGPNTFFGTGTLHLGDTTQMGTENVTLIVGGPVTTKITTPIVVEAGNNGTVTFSNSNSATQLSISSNITLNKSTIMSGGTSTSSLIFDGVVSGVGGITIINGTLNNSVPQIFKLTNDSNSFSGPVSILSNGTGQTVLTVSSITNGGLNSAIGSSASDASNLIIDGTLQFNGGPLGAISNRLFLIPTNKTATFDVIGGAILSLSGAPAAPSGSEKLTKTGAGTFTLTGTSQYTGATTVSAGTLIIDGSLSSGTITTVASSATICGAGILNGSLIVPTGAILNPGDIGLPGTLSVLGSLTFSGASQLNYQLNAIGDGGVSAPVQGNDFINCGSLSLNSAMAFSISTTGALSGKYTLIKAASTITGSLPAAPISMPTGYSGTFSLSADSKSLLLTVTGPTPATQTFTWTGAGNDPLWTNTANWVASPSAPRPAPIGDGTEDIVFSDNGSKTILYNNVSTVNQSYRSISFINNASGFDIIPFNVPSYTGTTTLNSNQISSLSTFDPAIAVGWGVAGANIPLGTIITAINGNMLTMSQNAVGNASNVTLTFSQTINLTGPLSMGVNAPLDCRNVSGTNTVSVNLLLSKNGSACAINVTNAGATLKIGNGATLTTSKNSDIAGTTVTGVTGSTTSDLAVGMPVFGQGIAPGTLVASITSANSFVLSTSASTGTGIALTFSTANSGIVDNGGSLLTITGAGSLIINYRLTGAGGLAVSTSGTATLAGTNLYFGATTVGGGSPASNGILKISSDGNFGAAPAVPQKNIVFDGGTLNCASTGPVTIGSNRNIGITTNGGTLAGSGGNFQFGGIISDSGSGFPGILSVTSSAPYTPNVQNTYTGGTNILSGMTTPLSGGSTKVTRGVISGAFGSGTIHYQGGLFGNGGGTPVSLDNILSVEADWTRAVSGSGGFSLNGPIVLTASSGSSRTISDNGNPTNALILNGVISESNSNVGLALYGTGVIQLNNANNLYSGSTTIGTTLNVASNPGSTMAGYVSVVSIADAGFASSLGTGSTIVFSNLTPALFYSGQSGGTDRSIVISTNAQCSIGSSGQLNLTGPITGGTAGTVSLSAGLNAVNGANIQNMGSAGVVTLYGTNSFSGDVQITNGFLGASSSNSLGTDTGRTLVLNSTNGIPGNAALQLGMSTDNIYDLPVFAVCKLLNSGGSIVTSASGGAYTMGNMSIHGASSGATLVLNGPGSLSLTGDIDEDTLSPLGLVKSGTGTVTLSGTLSFTGGTAIKGGILKQNTMSTLGAVGGISVSGGNSAISGSILRGIQGAHIGSLTTQNPNGGVVWPGTSNRCAEMTGNEVMHAANINLTHSGKLAVLVNPNGVGTAFGQVLNVTGNMTIDSSSILSVGYASGTSTDPFTVLSAGNTQTTAFNIATAGGNYLDSTQPGYPGDFKVKYFNGSSLVITDPEQGSVIGDFDSVRLLFDNPSVTPVKINSFTARNSGAGILIEWNCVSEFQNAGFNLYRKSVTDDSWQRVNQTMIPGRLTNPDEKKYAYYDWPSNGCYEYKLKSLDMKGTSEAYAVLAGPVNIDTAFGSIPFTSEESISAAQFSLSHAESAFANANAETDALIHIHPKSAATVTINAVKTSPGNNTEGQSRSSNVAIPSSLNPLASSRWFGAGMTQTNVSFTAAKVCYQTAGIMKIPVFMIPAGFDTGHLAIEREGRGVPILAATQDSLIVFGEGFEDDYTNKDALFLRATVNPTLAGVRTSAQGLFASSETVSTVCPATVSTSYHDVYFDYNISYRPYTFPPWFSNEYLTANAENGSKQAFTLDAPQTTDSASTLTINLWSLTQSAQNLVGNDHALEVVINGQTVGTAQWSGGNKMLQLTFDVPMGVIKADANLIELLTPAISGVDNQVAFLHSMTLAYTKILDGSQPSVVSNLGASSQLFEVCKLPSENVWVVDARFPDRAALVPYETRLNVDGSYSLRFRAGAGGSGAFYIVPEGMEELPTSITKRIVKPINSVDYLATGPSSFQANIQPLLLKHSKEGLRSQSVDQEQLFDYYNYGRYGPAGIQKAVQAIRPRYLLLLGRTIYDYKNYSGLNVDPLCPTFLVSTTFWSQATSDSMFGDIGRGYPEVAIGRLPVNNSDELNVVVQHILNYRGVAQSDLRVSATSDHADPLVADFPAQAAALVKNFPDVTWQPNFLTVTHASSQEVNAAMTAAADGGADWLVYIGHGNASALGNVTPAILDISSVQKWKGNAILLQSTCTAHWMAKDVANFRSIAIQGMVQPQGGVCASVGTSTYMNSGCAVPFLSNLLSNAMNAQRNNGQRWGDVVLSAQQWAFTQQSASSFYLDLSRTEQLFGDPAMQIYSPAQNSTPSHASKTDAPNPGTF